MRFIDPIEVQRRLTAAWLARAAAALAAVSTLSPDDRRAAIESRAKVWQDLADTLAEASEKKCWYCETEGDRWDWEVDHYRPKGRVLEALAPVPHPGYWWLAFEWTNLRLACTFCNQRRTGTAPGTGGGKRDHFPLLPGGVRAFTPAHRLPPERPVLLDPACATDPKLLIFMFDGRAEARHSRAASPEKYARACESIEIYHLNEPDLVDARVKLYNDVLELVREAADQSVAAGAGDAEMWVAYTKSCAKLVRFQSSKARYSAAAASWIELLRTAAHPWLADI